MKKEATGFRLIFGYLGMFMIFIGLLTALPLVLLIFYPEEKACLTDFLAPTAIYIVIGLILYLTLIYKRPRKPFVRCEDRHILMAIWLAAILAGALPFIHAHLAHGMDMSFSESIFESASAYSTTGLTAFKDYINVDGAYSPHVFVYHRAQMQFIGGAGLILVLASILSSSGSMSLFSSEGHTDRILPTMGKTAKVIFAIMFGWTIIGTLCLWLAGMPIYDAVIISMCAISGGGMSPTSDSIGYYRTISSNGLFTTHPMAIEIIVMFLSAFSAISYTLHVMFLKGKVGKFFRDVEIRFALIVVLMATIFTGIGACSTYAQENGVLFGTNGGELFWESLFYTVTCAATTGFSTGNIAHMVSLGKPLIYTSVVLMIIGGGMGSCGGGIKQFRIVLCIKNVTTSIRYRFSSSRTLNPVTVYRYGQRQQIEESKFKEAHNYAYLYLTLFLALSAILCFLPGIGPEEAMFDVASGMSNTGLALIDYVAYGKAHPKVYPILLWTLSIGMVLGRLEIMPLIDTIRNYVLEFKVISSEHRKKKEMKESN